MLSESEQRGNIVRLTVAQALVGANAVVVYATGAILGHTLAPEKTLATLPIWWPWLGLGRGGRQARKAGLQRTVRPSNPKVPTYSA